MIVLLLGLVGPLAIYAWWLHTENAHYRALLEDLDDELEELHVRRLADTTTAARLNGTIARSLLVWAVLAALWWLDRDGCIVAQQSNIFGAIVGVFEVIGEFFGFVAGAVATSLVAVVTWLVAMLGWLWDVVKVFMGGVGAVFAKVWDGLQIVWSDVLKPAFQWIDQTVIRVRDWLKATFGPVFEFLRRVRDAVTGFYKTFIKPIFTLIDFVRQLDRALQLFHIRLLSGIDAALTALERRIEVPLLWIYGKLNEILNVLTTIVTADGFFQRYTFLRTAARDVGYQWRILMNSVSGPLTAADLHSIKHAAKVADGPGVVTAISGYLGGDSNWFGDTVNGAIDRMVAELAAFDNATSA